MAHYIEPVIWEDEKFSELSYLGRLVWLYLLTGRCRTIFPGLVVTQPQTIAGKIPPASVEDIEGELGELVSRGMIEMDRHLVRLINAPKYARCLNASILRGWYRIWKDLPRSPLKYAQLAPLHRHCIIREHASVQAEWEKIFAPELVRWASQNTVDTVHTVSTVDTVRTVDTVHTVSTVPTVPPSEKGYGKDIDMKSRSTPSTLCTPCPPSQLEGSPIAIDHSSSRDSEDLDGPIYTPDMSAQDYLDALDAFKAAAKEADKCKH